MIELENVGYNYGGGELLSDVSVKLAPGSFHFLTGPSGAGKTTLLKLCYGALTPTSGRARAFNMDVQGLDRDQMAHLRRRVGVVHQDCRFLDHLTLRENLALPLTVAGRVEASENDNIDDLLAWVGLEHRQSALPPELSGGERQRAALAPVERIGNRVLIGDFGLAETLDTDAETRSVHHDEHGSETLVLLADEPARGAVVIEHAGRIAVDAHLVFDRAASDAIALTRGAVFIDDELGHDEQ